ncbi:hypothetical protein ACHQM5_002509 [Ranunculus cassubicifolius]
MVEQFECEESIDLDQDDEATKENEIREVLLGSSPNKNSTVGDALELKEGMVFESHKAAYSYYNKYAKQKGFGIRTRNSQKRGKIKDMFTVYDFVCCREGKTPVLARDPNKPKKRRNTLTNRCECKARMKFVLQDTGVWLVKFFDDDHSHGLASPSKIPMIRSHKVFPAAACILAEKFKEANLPVGKIPLLLGGDLLGFDARDCYNHLNYKVKPYKRLNEGDATATYNYFKKKSLQDPHFFYAIQCDNEDRAVNFFWVDGRSRMQYKHFGDVVSFDTTYKKNAYEMPFGPFTGINHHFQSIQFGCALLLDETEESFVWLFETWLGAMGGKPPVSILTDQDRAMTAAVRRVFPTTKHKFCFWHIIFKFPEHLAQVYKDNKELPGVISKCLWNTYTVLEFEEKWNEILLKYGLVDNEWLKGLYAIRESWVPVYHRDTFFGGQNTTGRSEGMNYVYKNFFSTDCNLQQFVHQNERCLKTIVLNEKQEDYDSEHKDPILNEPYFLLQSAGKLYTRNIYVKFKEQFGRAMHYKILKEEINEEFTTYEMRSRKKENSRIWKVRFSRSTSKGYCQCKMFEFLGIPCRHLIKLLVVYDIDDVPDHFILRRWTQGANSYKTMDRAELMESSATSETHLRILTHGTYLANQVVSDVGEDSEKYKMMVERFTTLLEEFKAIDSARFSAIGDDAQEKDVPQTNVQEEDVEEEDASVPRVTLLDPNISQTKGRRKANDVRFKRPIETVQEPKQYRKCSGCDKYVPHNARTCPNLVGQDKSRKSKKCKC